MSSELADRIDAALDTMGAYFMGDSPLEKAAVEISRRLDDEGVDHAIAGAICLAAHGVVRATTDVDVLVTREGLARFKERWLGRGYVNVRPGGKAVRDTVHGVKIDFLIAGDFPGDGAPKPVAFPEPGSVAVPAGRFKVVDLPRFVELKLASGMTAAHRLQDLADVLRLIETLQLHADFAQKLDPFVRQKFAELWQAAQHEPDDY